MLIQSRARRGFPIIAWCCVAIAGATTDLAAQPKTSDVRGIRTRDVSASELEVVVDYFYAGEAGTGNISLIASPELPNGSMDPALFESTEKSLRVGSHSETFVIVGTRPFTSARISVCMATEADAILCESFPHIKTWVAAGSAGATVGAAVSTEPTIESFATSSARIARGGSVMVTWVTNNADVALLGEPDPASATLLSSAQTVPVQGSLELSPRSTTTYVLQVQRGSRQTRQQLVIEVVPPIQISLDAPERACRDRPFKISWQTQYATRVKLNGRAVAAEGSLTVREHRDAASTAYGLMAENDFETAQAKRDIRFVPCPTED